VLRSPRLHTPFRRCRATFPLAGEGHSVALRATSLYRALRMASALDTSKAPGFSTFSVLITPSSTTIA
jgi:hypothetical protein